MDPLVMAALKGAFSFAGKKAAEQAFKTLTDRPISDEEYAIRVALTVLPEDRQDAGRQALTTWMETPEWRTKAVLKQLQSEGHVTPALISTFERWSHGLEDRDHPRVVAEAFLNAYWILVLKSQGEQFILDEQKLTLNVVREVQRDVSSLHHKQDEALALLNQIHTQLQVVGEQSTRNIHLPESPLAATDPYAQAMERIEHSLEDFALSAAQRRLEMLRPDQSKFTEAAQAKYLRLWGNLENNLGHPQEAAAYYIQAFEYDSNSPGGLTLRGYAAFLEGHAEQALKYLDRALLKQRRPDALALKVYALEDLARHEEIESIRAEGVRPEELELGLALAKHAIAQQRYDVALSDLAPLLSGKDADDARVKLTLAQIKIMPFDESIRLSPRPLTELPAAVKHHPELEEALDLANQVLAERGVVARPMLDQAMNIKQVILLWENRFDELVEASREALEQDPTDTVSRRHAVLALLALHRYEEAWQSFAQIPETERESDVRALGANAAEHTGRFDEAAILLEGLLAGELTPNSRENAVLSYARALLGLNRAEDAQLMLERESDKLPLVWLARSEVAQHIGDQARATAALQHAVAQATGDQAVRLSVQLAAYLRDQSHMEQAADVVRDIVDRVEDDETLVWAAYLFIEAEAYDDARAVVTRMEERGNATIVTLDLKAALLAELKQWEAAAEVDTHLLEARPMDGRTLWNAALVRSELRRTEEMMTLLERYVARPDANAEDLMRAAELGARFAPGDLPLAWAYEARRSELSNPSMHHAYRDIASRCPHGTDLEEIQPESAVLLTNDEQKRWVVLTADKTPARERGEFSLDSREADLLMGRKRGDTVKLREGHGGTYYVSAIITKFANAERMYFQEFHELFPADNSMIRMKVFDPKPNAEDGLPEDWNQIIRDSENVSKRRQEVRRLIEQHQYAHTINATLSLESATSFWSRTFRESEGYISHTGGSADAKAAEQLLSTHTGVVDVSALLSLSAANLLPTLLIAPLAWQVTSETVHEMEKCGPTDTIVIKALQFVRTHLSIVDMPKPSNRLLSLFPVETVSSITTAETGSLPLLMEDFGFRHSNREGSLGAQVTSCGTVDFLLALYRAGHTDQATLEDQLFHLLLSGRRFIPLSTGLIQRALDHDAGEIGSATHALLRLLLEPRITAPYQALMAIALLQRLWSQPDINGRRSAIAQHLVTGLHSFQDRIQRFKQIIAVGHKQFFLLHGQWREINTILHQAQAKWGDSDGTSGS